MKARMGWRMLRGITVVAVALAVAMGWVTTAIADPAAPTNYRSELIAVQDADGLPVELDMEILGGDAFVAVAAAPGQEVEVPGYEGEPYIRFRADGTVEVNQRSPARWLNDGRYGAADIEVPASADAEAPPSWLTVATDGRYAWHDHRVHVMTPAVPRGIHPSLNEVQRLWDWEIPLTVDGSPVVARGTLDWVPSVNPSAPLGLLVVVLAGALVLARKGSGWTLGLTMAAATVGVIAGVGQVVGFPAGAEPRISVLVLPLVALAVAVLGIWRTAADDPRAPWLTLLACVPLLVMGALAVPVLTKPIVPGALPVEVLRFSLAVIIALAAAGALSAARRLR